MTVTPYCYLVVSPILHPVAARTGDMVVVQPGHPEFPVVVVRRISGEWVRVRVGPANYGAILVREDEGCLIEMTASSQRLSEHPLVQSA